MEGNLSSGHPETLKTHHLDMLQESAISDEIITERGYASIDDPSILAEEGFSTPQRRTGSGLLLPIYGVTGERVGTQFRPDSPRSNKEGKRLKYETPSGWRMRLDVLPRHREALKDPSIPLWITEGIKKADALASLGACAVALMGVWNWRGTSQLGGSQALPDWEMINLKDRDVFLCFDNDYRDNTSVLLALHRLAGMLKLRGAIVWWIDLPAGLPKLGVDDFIAQGHSLNDVLSLRASDLPEIPKMSQVDMLLAIARDHLQLFNTPSGELLATATYADGHREVYTVGERGSSLRNWLLLAYRKEREGAVPSQSALSLACETIAAECSMHGETVNLFTRIAPYGEKLYLDLATPTYEAIEIDSDGWRIVRQPPVLFRRTKGMSPLPMPESGGSLDELTNILGLEPDSHEAILIKAWMVGTLHPKGPYPILKIQGEQGSGKTSATIIIRQSIDPNAAPTRSQPNDEEALILAALNGYVVALENVSHLPPWLSDGLCRISTGAGLSRRTLYTDSGETIFYVTRPVIVNGITQVATRGDLIDRLISVELPIMNGTKRRESTDVMEEFENKRGRILGALLDAASEALKNYKNTKLESLPRMADFAVWVEAAHEKIGLKPGEFMEVYDEQRDSSIDFEIEASPVARALLEYLKKNPDGILGPLKDNNAPEKGYKGLTTSDILPCLTDVHTDFGSKKPAKDWPDSPTRLGAAFTRIAPAMRTRGWSIERASGSRREGRRWIVSRIENDVPNTDSEPAPDGDTFETARCHQNGQGVTKMAKVSPVVSPYNPLDDEGLGQNNLFGDAGDTLKTHSSVPIKYTETGVSKNRYVLEDRAYKVSPASPASPAPIPGPNDCPACGCETLVREASGRARCTRLADCGWKEE